MSTLLKTYRRRTLTLACLALGAFASQTPGVSVAQSGTGEAPKPSASATLQQCLTSATQTERSATFEGEINAIPGTARMEMRIDVLERVPGDLTYHTVTAPGLGVWRNSAPGVKSYTYLKQVTNLSAPAFYRGAVRFRWMSARGHLLKSVVLRTHRCEQSVDPMETETTPPTTIGPGKTG